MGQYAKGLMAQVIADTAVTSVSSLMEVAQTLGGLARAVLEEECDDLVNPNQLVEAAARCIDTIELIVTACGPDEGQLGRWHNESRLGRDVRKTKKKLNQLREELFDVTKD
jgi:hypothetical protein